MDKNKSSGLRKRILIITIIPILLLGFLIACFSYFQFNKTMEHEVQRNLKNVAMATVRAYDQIYPGDYGVAENEDGSYRVTKGGVDLTDKVEYIDELHNDSGIDITLFYLDIRILTTIRNEHGNRISGTVVNKMVVDDIFGSGEGHFYNNMHVNGTNYYAYYAPLVNSDGSVVGMMFAGKPTAVVKQDVLRSAIPIIGIAIAMMIIVSFIGTSFSKELAQAIGKEKNFLGAIAGGNLRAQLDASIIARKDEIGEMGRFTVHVQKFIRDMIERDPLTKLYTRRIGELKIQYAQQSALENNSPYCVAMCDIDFFKKFNDTYGHDCGDQVLRETAAIFNRVLFREGFAVRWGGEEFIIIYEEMNMDQAYKALSKLREEVINHVLEYGEERMNITMTFGLVEGDSRNINDIVKVADELLYYGKTHGRNQIVRGDEVDIEALKAEE